jgi:hypothetical protein
VRCNEAELGGATMQYFPVNWEVPRCGIGRRIGRRIGRSNDAESGSQGAQGLRFGTELGGCYGVELGGELAGETVQYWQANWEVERCRIGSTAVQIRPSYWEMQGGTIGR